MRVFDQMRKNDELFTSNQRPVFSGGLEQHKRILLLNRPTPSRTLRLLALQRSSTNRSPFSNRCRTLGHCSLKTFNRKSRRQFPSRTHSKPAEGLFEYRVAKSSSLEISTNSFSEA